jgi:hypothetical protein
VRTEHRLPGPQHRHGLAGRPDVLARPGLCGKSSLDPVFEADDARAAAGVGAADAVVADREGEGAVAVVRTYFDDRGPRLPGGVGRAPRPREASRRPDVLCVALGRPMACTLMSSA